MFVRVMYIERGAAPLPTQVASIFSLFLRDCRLLFLYVTTVPKKHYKKRPGLSYERTQFASYNQFRESPEGLFSGRLHATNGRDEFAFRCRDGGYHSRSEPFYGINTKHRETEGMGEGAAPKGKSEVTSGEGKSERRGETRTGTSTLVARVLVRGPTVRLTYLNVRMQRRRRPEQALTLSGLVLEQAGMRRTLRAVSRARKTENRTRIRLR